MKIYKLPQLAELNPNNEYCLGPDIDSSIYLVYGRLRPNEPSRKIAPAQGKDEIVCVIKGSIRVRCGKSTFSVGPGEAFHSKDAQVFTIENPGDEEVVYIAAGSAPIGQDQAAPSKCDAEKTAIKPEETPEESKEEDDDEFEITSDDSQGDEETE
ncbi:MAG: hypothetical protein HY954_05690 [Deltaproteobacteria bacterium]|nr:hypothetical protein [Deltaproteobacteria bacterium]